MITTFMSTVSTIGSFGTLTNIQQQLLPLIFTQIYNQNYKYFVFEIINYLNNQSKINENNMPFTNQFIGDAIMFVLSPRSMINLNTEISYTVRCFILSQNQPSFVFAFAFIFVFCFVLFCFEFVFVFFLCVCVC